MHMLNIDCIYYLHHCSETFWKQHLNWHCTSHEGYNTHSVHISGIKGHKFPKTMYHEAVVFEEAKKIFSKGSGFGEVLRKLGG